MIVYLNDGYRGGETIFPKLNIKVVPKAGDALLFDNVVDGKVDQRSLHAGLPVEVGTKWIATRWIRRDPFDPWQGTE